MEDENKTKAEFIAELRTLRKESGSVLNWIEQQQAQVKEWDKTRMLEMFFEHTLSQVVFLDPEFNFIRVNKLYAEGCQRDVSEFPGNNHFDFFPSDAQLIFEEVVRTKEPYRTLARPFVYSDDPDRGVTYWDWNLVPVLDADGEVEMLVFSLNEVTEHKRAEEALKLSEERFRAIFEQAAVGVAQLETKSGRFMRVNEKYCDVAGYSQEEMLERTFEDITHEDDLQEDLDNRRRLTDGEIRSFSMEKRYVHKDGSIVWVNLTVSPMWEIGEEPNFHIAVVEDITQRRAEEEKRRDMEQQLQHAQKLESLGVLAGGIAHDFNNILMGVLGFSELALRDLLPGTPASECIEDVRLAAKRAAELSKQMLAYSGRGKFLVQPLNLSTVVKEMADLLTVSISKKANMTHRLPVDIPTIEADATQIRQVVMNLITNASDALGEENGEIRVSTGSIKCDRDYLRDVYLSTELQEGLYVYVEVTDTGCGMDVETMDKIFDPFFTTKFTGRGLGLAAVLGIVQSHGGAMKIESEPDRGTTFTVLFPASRRPVETPQDEGVSSDDWSGTGTVLVVDDEESIRKLCCQALERVGFKALQAADGAEGLELFQQYGNEIKIVLLDLTMPRMGGEEMLQKLHQSNNDVRVILSSGYNEEETLGRLGDNDTTMFIQKPYGIKELVSKFRAIAEMN